MRTTPAALLIASRLLNAAADAHKSSLKQQLRRVYKLIHPDLFHGTPKARVSGPGNIGSGLQCPEARRRCHQRRLHCYRRVRRPQLPTLSLASCHAGGK